MRSPFPGKDPFLESPALWSSFQSRLIVAIANAIEETLSPEYYVEVETRTYLDDEQEELLIGIPDVSIIANSNLLAPPDSSNLAIQVCPQQVTIPMPVTVRERYLEIRQVKNHQAITALELLSPKNKKNGAGRDRYLKKRQDILSSATHLVELDLLRIGQSMPMTENDHSSTYRILISRSPQRPAANLYPIQLWQPLPNLPIPLKTNQEIVPLSLQTVVDEIYSRARYSNRIDYSQPIPSPSLTHDEQAWVQSQLRT